MIFCLSSLGEMFAASFFKNKIITNVMFKSETLFTSNKFKFPPKINSKYLIFKKIRLVIFFFSLEIITVNIFELFTF